MELLTFCSKVQCVSSIVFRSSLSSFEELSPEPGKMFNRKNEARFSDLAQTVNDFNQSCYMRIDHSTVLEV